MRTLLLAATLAVAATATARPDSTRVFALPERALDSAVVGLRLLSEAPDALGLPDPAALAELGARAVPGAPFHVGDWESSLDGSPDGSPVRLPVRSVVFLPLETHTDSRADTPVDSLVLPAGMPFYTRMFWGRHGLVRTLGLAPSSRRGELALRRGMLTWHQRMGLVTWAAFTGQFVMGEIMAASPSKRADLSKVHGATGYATFGLYTGTAALSLMAPPGRRYSSRMSSTKIHKYLALVHFTGMMATPLLGVWVAEGSGNYDRRLNTHQWVTRVTYAAYTAALSTMYFFR